jgi:hypothetical protein
MRVQLHLPGKRVTGRDVYHRVALMPSGPGDFPFRLVFAYLLDVDGDGRSRWDCVEFWLEQDVNDPEQLHGRDDVPVITPPVMRDLASRFQRLEQVARAHLGTAPGVERVDIPRRRRELSDAFLRGVAASYRAYRDNGWSPTQTLARENGVSRRTAASWVAKAREAGHLEPRASQREED